MEKITFWELEQVMACDLNKKRDPCIEINFEVDGCTVYRDSWLGKLIDRNTKDVCYWFGLTPDGSQAYDFYSFEAFANAKVFYENKSLKEMLSKISFFSLGGGTVDEMLPFFLNAAKDANELAQE